MEIDKKRLYYIEETRKFYDDFMSIRLKYHSFLLLILLPL